MWVVLGLCRPDFKQSGDGEISALIDDLDGLSPYVSEQRLSMQSLPIDRSLLYTTERLVEMIPIPSFIPSGKCSMAGVCVFLAFSFTHAD